MISERDDDRSGERGFSLIELLIVVGMIATLAGLGFQAGRAALLSARLAATLEDIDTLEGALLLRSGDCPLLRRNLNDRDPGLVARFNRADRDCWRGPYLTSWRKPPVGGDYRYMGRRGRKVTLRLRFLEEHEANMLASAIVRRFGADALGRLRRRRSGWQIDFVATAAPTVP